MSKMPLKSGKDLIKEIRQEDKSIPVAVITAKATQLDLEKNSIQKI
jgi:DNA-binding response OmpR family regulator